MSQWYSTQTILKADNLFRDVAYACLQDTDAREDNKMKTSEENTKKLLNAKYTLLKKMNDVEIHMKDGEFGCKQLVSF